MAEIDAPVKKRIGSLPVLRSRVDIAPEKLAPGMFVVGLDRPWEGTPFMLQGFLIDDAEQIVALKTLCKTVTIDPRRSATDSLRDVLNLYILPEDMLEGDEAEETEAPVRIRYVESARRSVAQPEPSKASAGERMRRTLNAVVTHFRDPLASRRREKMDAAAGLKKIPAVAFARTQFATITHVPLGQRRKAGPRTKPKKKITVAPATAGPSLPNMQIHVESPPTARFDEFALSLKEEWTDFTEGFREWQQAVRRWWLRHKMTRLLVWNSRKKPALAAPERSTRPRPIDLVIYRERVPIQQEVYQAREAISVVEEALTHLRQDLELEASVRVDGLPLAIEGMVASCQRNPDALVWISRVRLENSTTYLHGVKVASYLLAFGRHLGFQAEQLGQLAVIGLLMDVGKLAIDPAILNKRGALTKEEFATIKGHVGLGIQMLSETMMLDPAVRQGIEQHHEWIDGGGYPKGLSGDDISVFGRMAAIVDAYAALTTDRPHAPPLSSYDALQVIYGLGDRQFHTPLVEQFVRAIGLFPVGSLVLLSSEEVAVVTQQDRKHRLEPRVLVLTTPEKCALERAYELDLTRRPKDTSGKPIRILRSLPSGIYGIDFRNFYIG